MLIDWWLDFPTYKTSRRQYCKYIGEFVPASCRQLLGALCFIIYNKILLSYSMCLSTSEPLARNPNHAQLNRANHSVIVEV